MNQEQIRCFIAIEIPETFQTPLTSAQEELRKYISGASWVKRGNIHLTLKFLGDVVPNQISVIKNSIEQVTDTRLPFSMELGGIGAFPNLSRPRVIWAGVKTGADQVAAIAREIDDGLSRHAFERDEKPFRPHITLARLKRRINLDPFVDVFRQYDTINGATMVVNQVQIIQSQLRPSGTIYTPLETCYFNGRTTT